MWIISPSPTVYSLWISWDLQKMSRGYSSHALTDACFCSCSKNSFKYTTSKRLITSTKRVEAQLQDLVKLESAIVGSPPARIWLSFLESRVAGTPPCRLRVRSIHDSFFLLQLHWVGNRYPLLCSLQEFRVEVPWACLGLGCRRQYLDLEYNVLSEYTCCSWGPELLDLVFLDRHWTRHHDCIHHYIRGMENLG